MEAALKCLWAMGKIKKKRMPRGVHRLVADVEGAFPEFHNVFSVQMKRKDSFGNDGYCKVNGWGHSDPEMWSLYRDGQEVDLVLTPLHNMVAFAQTELLRYDPTLLDGQRYWSRKYE